MKPFQISIPGYGNLCLHHFRLLIFADGGESGRGVFDVSVLLCSMASDEGFDLQLRKVLFFPLFFKRIESCQCRFSQGFRDLQVKVVEQRKEKQRQEQQKEKQRQERRIAELTREQLQALPPGNPVYKTVGRM